MYKKTTVQTLILLVVVMFIVFLTIKTENQSSKGNTPSAYPVLEVPKEKNIPEFGIIFSETYQGSQTVKALLESFGKIAKDTALEEKYPQSEWIEMLLEKGIVIENYNDYSGYMVARRALVRLENQPEMWNSDIFGIPSTTDWETFKAAYIDRKIWEYQQVRAATQADPTVSGGLFMGTGQRVFLPAKPGRVYVKRTGTGAMFYGESLNEVQEFDLLHKGIEPEGYEVTYIDENGNRLAETPPPISREDIIKELTLPPDGWIPPEGWTPPPWLEPALRAKGWKGTFFPQYNVDALDSLNPDGNATPISDPGYISNDTDPNSFTNTERLKEIQPSEDERNRSSPTGTEITPESLLRLTELEPDFEKQFMLEFSEFMSTERIKTQLPKQFTSERLTHALEILEHYGLEEGIYHLKEADPDIARQVENLLQDKRSKSHD